MSVQKRFCSFFLVGLAIFLAACGGSNSPTSSNSGPVTLTMWTWKIFHVPALQAIAKDFEKKTGITVKVTAYNPDDVYRTKVTTAAQGDELPDILSYWSGGQFDLAGSGILTDISGQVDDTWKSNFLAGTYEKSSMLTQSTYDTCQKDPKCTYKNLKVGQSFSVPYLAGQAMYVYASKSLLQKAGLTATPPKTAEEWLQMMQTVKDKTGTAGLVVGAKNGDTLNFWLFNPMLMTSCGEKTYDDIYNGKTSFSTPCAMKVINWMNSVARDKLWTPDVLQTDIDPADVAFSQGKAAFDIGGTYTLGFLISQGMNKDDLLSFPMPALQGGFYSELKVPASALIDAGITKDSRHQKEALEFLKFLTSTDEMELFARTANDLPAVKVPADPDKVGAVLASLASGLSADSPFIRSTGTELADTNKQLDLSFQQLITGEITPAVLAQKADATNQAAWKQHGGS